MRPWISACLLTAGCAAGADFTGTWIGVLQPGDGSQPQGVCLSLWQGSGVSGHVTFDDRGESADIASGRGDGNRIEFQAQSKDDGPVTFALSGGESKLSGQFRLGDKTGTVSLTSYMPNGRANTFGPAAALPISQSRAQPEYTAEARAAKLQGRVVLLIEILPSGALGTNIRVSQGLGMGLDEKAIECVRKWRFNPPTMDCKAVHKPMQIQINFRLP
jgi:TonB family protein